MKDNKTNVLGSPTDINQTINIGTAYTNPDDASTGTSQITLKGILIGGQPGSIDYKMLPTSQSFDHVIYDKTLPTDANNWIITESASTPIYTVVFDNYTTATDQKDVLVALELVNNTGYDFYGWQTFQAPRARNPFCICLLYFLQVILSISLVSLK